MALPTASLIKFKPYNFMPLRRAKPLNPSSDKNPEFFSLKTSGKRESFNLYSSPNKNSRNVAAKSMATNEIPSSEEAEVKKYSKIPLSDVVVKTKRNVFWGRKWNVKDIERAGKLLTVHLLSLFAPFYFNWGAFWVAFGILMITGLGITLSYHRNLSHGSFKLPKWLEYSFAYCGLQALQGSPTEWVSTHRYHHQFCDSERDPHSPIEGFWHSHLSWMFDTNSIAERGVRAIISYHITFLVNSACHVWGNQAWNTGDLSRNNWWVGILALGEGWHNNHHAFEYSARQGLEWYQIDMTWYFLCFLQAIGLATDVKLPNELQKQRMAFKN